MTLRELESVADLRACEALQLRVWGEPTPEVTVATFRAVTHAGGLVAGAFEEGALLGFVFAFPSFVAGRVGQHSHLLAVAPPARGRGVGRALKWFQRAWCLERGVDLVTWTFDPLQARNAKLNLEHLGAHGCSYLTDFYGVLGGPLNGALPSDRLLAAWPLRAEHVAALAAGRPRPPALKPPLTLLAADSAGEPQLYRDVLSAPEGGALWLELPRTVAPTSAAAHALRWRLALREVLRPALEQGYRVGRFVANGYLLERPALGDAPPTDKR